MRRNVSEVEQPAFKREVASIRLDLALLRFAMAGRKALHHSNFQPRVPAGNPDGGQFAEGGGQRVQLAQRGRNRLPGISGSGGGHRGHQ